MASRLVLLSSLILVLGCGHASSGNARAPSPSETIARVPPLELVEHGLYEGWKRFGDEGPLVHPDLSDEVAIAVYVEALMYYGRAYPVYSLIPEGGLQVEVRTSNRVGENGEILTYCWRQGEGEWHLVGKGTWTS